MIFTSFKVQMISEVRKLVKIDAIDTVPNNDGAV